MTWHNVTSYPGFALQPTWAGTEFSTTGGVIAVSRLGIDPSASNTYVFPFLFSFDGDGDDYYVDGVRFTLLTHDFEFAMLSADCANAYSTNAFPPFLITPGTTYNACSTTRLFEIKDVGGLLAPADCDVRVRIELDTERAPSSRFWTNLVNCREVG